MRKNFEEETEKQLCGGCKKEFLLEDLEKINTQRGPLYLCEECRCYNNLHTKKDVSKLIAKSLISPRKIVEKLDEVVVGQHQAKKDLALEVYHHFLRIAMDEKITKMGKRVKKNNIFLTGPSGTGKTFLIQTLAKILDVPFYIADATSLTEAGYVGSDVETVLSGLIMAANNSIEKAQCGIVYIDEIDKIAKKGENVSITRDVSGEGVQQSLLKLVEGSVVDVQLNAKRMNPNAQGIPFDTTNVLFIVGGAFDGIEEIVKKRLKISDYNQKQIGFLSDVKDSSKKEKEIDYRAFIEQADLQKYGMIPEFFGRFSVLSNLLELTKEELIQVMKIKNGTLEEYETLFEIQNKKLFFEDSGLEYIADHTISQKTGARGLKASLNKVFRDILFELPESDHTIFTVNANLVKKILKEEGLANKKIS